MLKPKKYLPVRDKKFFTPLIKENLRLEFSSSENRLDDLALLSALMLRDGKSADDIAAVTLLPQAVITNTLDELKTLGLVDERNELAERTKHILKLSDCVNSFNVSPPKIFLDSLTKLPVLLPSDARVEKFFDDTDCAAAVKHHEQIPTVDYNIIEEFLFEHFAKDFRDELEPLRLPQKSEVLFAARELRFLPVVGEDNFADCVELKHERTINAELPVRKFVATSEAGEQKLFVDMVLGTILPEIDNEPENSEEVTLFFKPSPNFAGDELLKKLPEVYGEVFDAGIFSVKVELSSEVAGDFLCG